MRFERLVPDDSFIGQYLTMMEEQETPYVYDFFGALWALSAVLGRGFYVARPKAPVYMNWYIMLVADSGITRKSTAVNAATSLIREYFTIHKDQGMLLEEKATTAAIVSQLQERTDLFNRAHIHISVSELARFLGRDGSTYDLPIFLTDMYDCPAQKLRLTLGSSVPVPINNVYITFFSASTPEWLKKTVNPNVVAGGFTSRCLFVMSDVRKKLIAWPDDGSQVEQRAAILAKLEHLATTAHLRKTISLNLYAKQAFIRWYKSREQKFEDAYNNSFYSREDAHVLRMAACLAVNDESWEINNDHLRNAIAVIQAVKAQGGTLFAGAVVDGRAIQRLFLLRKVLVAAGERGMAQSVLSTRMQRYFTSVELLSALSIMHELGMIKRFEVRLANRGRSRTVWTATNLIGDDHTLESILTYAV